MSLSTSLERLANYRIKNTRASRDIFDKGLPIFDQRLNSLGDEKWTFLEQFSLAAVDIGRIDVAGHCLNLLAAQFPDSPRVQCLEGILEETRSPVNAQQFYEKLLAEDGTNGAAWKRLVAVLRRQGQIDKAVCELSEYLDTFYNDVEGWLELADIYASVNQYTYSLQSLSHALLLAPQNPFYFLKAAETAYTAGDVTLALKYFLMTVDMTDDTGDKPAKDSVPTGITLRAWYGVELCTRRLQAEHQLASQSESDTPSSSHLPALHKLATKMLTMAYASKDAVASVEATRRLLS
ncbi:TPR-like protein [Peniophora sp. CONT]|nr:TPR-like protein [Peniophora sp. CONT]